VETRDSNSVLVEDGDRLLSVDDVADLLSVSRNWVYRQARSEGLVPLRVGKHCRWRARDVRAWIELQAEAAMTEAALAGGAR